MALDLSKIKSISDDVKAKLAKATNKEELIEVIKAANLSEEQMKELNGGTNIPGCGYDFEDYCFGESCQTLPL